MPQSTSIPAAASEGFKATSESKAPSWWHKVPKSVHVWLWALLSAMAIELVIFNHTALFFDEDAYPHQIVNLPQQPALGRNAYGLDPQHNAVTMTLPDLPVKSVYVQLALGVRYLVEGKLELRTTSRAYGWSTVGSFKLTGAGRDDTSAAYLKVLPKGEVKELRLSFEPKSIAGGVAIVALELNKPIPVDFRPLRVLLLSLVLTFAWSAVRESWRQGRIIVGSRRYRQITRSCLTVMLLGAAVLFYSTSPYVATEGGFKFISNGFLPYNTPNHDLLVPLPQTPEQYEMNDEYIQMLAAYTSGQLSIPYQADPRLAQATNVYDNSELFAKNIPFLWDHSYHKGKYYVYFGVAPLITIYYPIYLLTGEAPCAALAAFIATIYALLGLYFGVTRLMRTLLRTVNPLLLGLSLITMALASGIYMMQGMMVFYILPYFLGFAALGVTLGTVTSLYTLVRLNQSRLEMSMERRALRKWRWGVYAELVVLGLSVVAMVTARPLNMCYQLLLLVPACWWFMRAQLPLATKLKASACVGITVLLGAIVVMWYNYARFGSIVEFGIFQMLTLTDTHYNNLTLNFELFFSVLYHYFFENFNLIANFPYVTPVFTPDLKLGNGTAVAERAGLLFFPFFWGLPLLWLLYRAVGSRPEPQMSRGNWQQHMMLGLLVMAAAVPLIMIAVGINSGFNMRYLCDATMVWAPLAALACAQLDCRDSGHTDEATHRAFIYWGVVAACLFTCATMFFITFSASPQFEAINPELMVELKRFFDPLSFT